MVEQLQDHPRRVDRCEGSTTLSQHPHALTQWTQVVFQAKVCFGNLTQLLAPPSVLLNTVDEGIMLRVIMYYLLL